MSKIINFLLYAMNNKQRNIIRRLDIRSKIWLFEAWKDESISELVASILPERISIDQARITNNFEKEMLIIISSNFLLKFLKCC